MVFLQNLILTLALAILKNTYFDPLNSEIIERKEVTHKPIRPGTWFMGMNTELLEAMLIIMLGTYVCRMWLDVSLSNTTLYSRHVSNPMEIICYL